MNWVVRSSRSQRGQAGSLVNAWQPSDVPVATSHTPELADLARMCRRLVRRFVTAAREDERATLPSMLTGHFGPSAEALPVVSDSWAPYEHVNVQLGLEGWLAEAGRDHRVLGVTGFQHRMFSLADLIQDETDMHGPGLGSVAMANQISGPGGQTYPCTQCGLYLVDDPAGPLAVLLRGSDSRGPQQTVSLEVMARDADLAGAALGRIRAVTAERNVFRRQVLSFGAEMFGADHAPISFQERPTLERDALVLPADQLEAIKEQVIGVAAHRDRLLASRQHLKRGLLLHGPPGTGKTHTIRYLISRLPELTVVILSGNALQYVGAACSIARTLAPSIVVIEDVDLIAEHRGMHPGQHPMLFQLLNEMDGLAEDADVTFILTTNRADLLEPALASRPGRVDQAVAFSLPDDAARRRLLQLYRGNLNLDLTDSEDVIVRTAGVTASFLKELLRKSALVAAAQDTAGTGALTVTSAHLSTALDRLLHERNELSRALLGAGSEDTASTTTASPERPKNPRSTRTRPQTA
jgi:DNA polymerase III delta prime subunit